MGTMFQLLEVYSSLYNIIIDFEELSLSEYYFKVTCDTKIIEFNLITKDKYTFSFYNFIFGKMEYDSVDFTKGCEFIAKNDNKETIRFIENIKKEKFNDLSDFVDKICYHSKFFD